MVLAAGVNLVLDPLLIFGWFGLPRMGIAGAALATVIARAASMCASLLLLAYRKRMLVLAVPAPSEVLDSWRRVLQIGLPAAASTLLYPITMAVITALVSGYGDSAVAAVGAGARIEGFAMMVLWATSTTLTPFVGQNWGAGRHDRVRRAEVLTGGFAVVWGLVCWGALAASSWWVGRLFSPEPEVIRHLVIYLWVVPAGYGLRGVCVLANAALNALHRPWRSALLNVVRLLGLYIPLAWLGGRIGGYPWLLGGISLANVLAGLVATALVAMPLSDAPAEGDLDESSAGLVRKSA
jgi:Na+-driven multidrug efflux pump